MHDTGIQDIAIHKNLDPVELLGELVPAGLALVKDLDQYHENEHKATEEKGMNSNQYESHTLIALQFM